MRSLSALLIAATAMLPSSALAQDCVPGSLFRAFVTYPSGPYPVDAVVGDFNEDGRPDLAVANFTEGTVSLFAGIGNGAFLPRTVLPTAQGGPRNLETADFNQDGITDLAVTCLVTHRLLVFMGLGTNGVGNGQFGPAIPTIVNSPRGLAVADFNEDGVLDVAVAGGDGIVLLRGDGAGGVGSGTFTFTASHPMGFPWAVTAGDWNQDGIVDLAVANVGHPAVNTLLGSGAGGIGDGTFHPGPSFLVGRGQTDIVASDLNQDGRTDLAISGDQTGNTVLLATGPSGTVAFNIVDLPGNQNHNGVVAADFDGDDFVDLAMTDPTNNLVLVYRGLGGGAFAAFEPYAMGGAGVGATLGDFDLNGGLDIAVANTTGNGSVSVLISNCGGPAKPVVVSANPSGGRVGDAVEIIGAFFTSTTSVRFNGVDAAFSVLSATLITCQVPVGATTGPIDVTTPVGTGTSSFHFFVGETPEILGADPLVGKVGASVVVTGRHFTGATRVAFGPESHAAFTVDSDEQITAKVDGLAISGPIAVTTPAATGVSLFEFTVIPFDTAARIVSVRDVRGDEGGRVVVRWVRSDFDSPTNSLIRGYRVWRRASLDALADARMARLVEASALSLSIDGFWESLAEIPAAFLDGYAFTAPTTQDSTEEGNPYTAFFVQTLTASPFLFFNSAIDSGYSVDNRGPRKPPRFDADYSPSRVFLRWASHGEADLKEFHLHRGWTLTFHPDTSNLIYAGSDTAFVDTLMAGSFYLLAAVDIHGNRSRYALVTPSGSSTGIAFMVEARATPRSVLLRWYAMGLAHAPVWIERRAPGQPWVKIANRSTDGGGLVVFEDTAVQPGAKLGYRIAVLEEGEEVYSAETWVDVPEDRLAFSSVTPNPVLADGQLVISFLLPSAGPVSLRVFDVTGRVMVARDLGVLEAGDHDERVSWARRPAPGVYWVRLSQHGKEISARFAVVR